MSLRTPEEIRSLQRKLCVKAAREPQFRFYALYDKVYRADVLAHAYRLCRRNGGAAGVDGMTFRDIDREGRDAWLVDLATDLREGTYRPQPVRRVMIPKSDGGQRPLGIPTVRDRVAQTAAKLVLEPIFEADFVPNAYGYRPKKSALDAVKEVKAALLRGNPRVVDADLKGYFDAIPHGPLMQSVARRISDGSMLRLLKAWLKVPVESTDDEGRMTHTGGKHCSRGTPQGGVISPLLANIYIHRLLKAWRKFDLEERLSARIINYADDLVIVCHGHPEEALRWLRAIVERLGLALNEEKTRVCNPQRESFDFLGYTFGPMVHPLTGRTYRGTCPSKESVARLKQSVSCYLQRSRSAPLSTVVGGVNRKLKGWAGYFSVGSLSRVDRSINYHTRDRVRRFLVRRHKYRGRGTGRFPTSYLHGTLGLLDLKEVRRPSTSFAES